MTQWRLPHTYTTPHLTYRRKAQRDLEWHLYNLRHWVWDAPNVKAAFPITMN